MRNKLNWRLGYSDNANTFPNEYFPATVPGAVQLDYAKNYNMPDYKAELNFKKYRWMEDKYWIYSANYDATELYDTNLFFVSEGIDYKFDILINGECKYSYEGMYRKVKINLSDLIGTVIKIDVVIYPVPKSELENVEPETHREANQSTKPAVSYGWDFHPRLVPLGIWNDTYILTTDNCEILAPSVTYLLNKDRSVATVNFSVNANEDISWRFYAPDGNLIFKSDLSEESFEIYNPLLWWCNGYGDPNLYSWELSVNGDEFSGKIGFKTVSLEMNEGTWYVPEFPKTRPVPPITLCLNGVNIFVKGCNWVSPEIFYATLNEKRYREQLTLVKEANLNFVRCWGGAVVNKEAFFDICDELGIMVWQEFPLACNNYVSTEKYLALLKNEALDIIERVSKHACHVMWCGGNELFNDWSGMTDQSLALRMLNSLTLDKTPNIPFIPTAPLMGMRHGNYLFVYFDGQEAIKVMQNLNNTAYTEFGMPAISNMQCLEQITAKENLFPFVNNELTRAHHGFEAWCHEETWALSETIAHYFGESESLEQLIERGQYLQEVGYRFIFEEARRQKPHCSMAANWCLNEPWPCIANNSLICYPNYIKPAYYEVAKACRNVAASARYRKFQHKAGEVLEFDLWMLNDGVNEVSGDTVNVFVEIGDGNKEHIIDWNFPDLKPNTNFEGPTLKYKLPRVPNADRLKIILSCGEYSSEYTLLYSC